MSASQISQALKRMYEPTCGLSIEAVELLLLLVKQTAKVDFEFIWQQRNRRNPKELAATLDELISAGLIREVPGEIAEIMDHWSSAESL
ncbi:hypothetical protein, partial [Acaryochloris sp. CCMEE 5410]|uniref:hypothetical protein n=1 Tax=Acaryochloris sp. CCMEE 5410 TaxID=310037 RepID=UPI000584C821